MEHQASFSCNLLLEIVWIYYSPNLKLVFLALINSSNSLKALSFSEINKVILEQKCLQTWGNRKKAKA